MVSEEIISSIGGCMKKRRQSPAQIDCLISIPQKQFVEELPPYPVYRKRRIRHSCVNYGNWSDHIVL
jgi:hypothetical protein